MTVLGRLKHRRSMVNGYHHRHSGRSATETPTIPTMTLEAKRHCCYPTAGIVRASSRLSVASLVVSTLKTASATTLSTEALLDIPNARRQDPPTGRRRSPKDVRGGGIPSQSFPPKKISTHHTSWNSFFLSSGRDPKQTAWARQSTFAGFCRTR